ncbi:hypothetical protein WN48_08290 [Eufriesea mexicana]|uniref:Uncharacterized protein n=1 Tax=Eufriesea mexicana TaxID=516756 RepID=A0A310SIG2_9HYME|nr:hypothetical protein WN48_08290 [Eufriesea mexicana]
MSLCRMPASIKLEYEYSAAKHVNVDQPGAANTCDQTCVRTTSRAYTRTPVTG